MRRGLLAISTAAAATVGCGKIKDAAKTVEDALFAEPEYEPVAGEDAAPRLHAATGAAPFDAAALSQALGMGASEAAQEGAALRGVLHLAEDDEILEVSGETIDFLVAGADQKAALRSESFAQPELATIFKPKTENGNTLALVPDPYDPYDPETADASIDEAAWGGKSEIIISTVGRVTVRDQAARGTCASFTGIGYLEYLIMKKHGAELAGVDLSEQRFYMMSKPDVWASGGGTTDVDGGSSWVTGFEMSFGKDGKTSPSSDARYNIPLEADCPYNGSPGANEIQIAQAASCARGAVRVSNMTSSYYTKSGNNPWQFQSNGAPRTARQIFDFVKNNDLPVPVGTVLTANWMDNDGMITLAKSKQPGFGPHAGGHAYLIVGMRKLDQTKFPNEGGMCFVIKNSWGTGWGLNGYSCMTLAWFNAHRGTFAFDVALDVDVDMAHLKANAAGSVPDGLAPSPATPVDPAAGGSEGTPVLADAPSDTPPAGGTPAAGDGGGTPPAAPAQTVGGFTVGKLVAKRGGLMQVLFRKDGGNLVLRGVHAGQQGTTDDLIVKLEGERILIDDAPRKKYDVVAGMLQNDLVTLCSGKYAQTCDLNYVAEENRLVVGVTEARFRDYEPDPDADYTELFKAAKYGVEAAIGDGVFGDFRFIVKNQPTNPIRLAIKPVSGDIMFQGQKIGDYQKLEFCSGAFKSVCRVLLNQQDRSLKILFKAKKNP